MYSYETWCTTVHVYMYDTCIYSLFWFRFRFLIFCRSCVCFAGAVAFSIVRSTRSFRRATRSGRRDWRRRMRSSWRIRRERRGRCKQKGIFTYSVYIYICMYFVVIINTYVFFFFSCDLLLLHRSLRCNNKFSISFCYFFVLLYHTYVCFVLL